MSATNQGAIFWFDSGIVPGALRPQPQRQRGDLQRAANKLAEPNVEIEYNGMMIVKSERMPKVVDLGATVPLSGIFRTILVGCQAACWAWGGAGESKSSVMAFVPYTRDADRFLMVRGGGILGCKKTVFDGKDYGVITASTYGAPIQA